MAKPEWGTKRTCSSCGARFYDLMRSPIICPKCQSPVEPEAPFKARRGSAEKVAAVKAAPVAPVDLEIEVEEEGPAEEEEGGIEDVDGGDEDESGLIEDASDLGEDDDDMAEVMEHLDENLEDEV